MPGTLLVNNIKGVLESQYAEHKKRSEYPQELSRQENNTAATMKKVIDDITCRVDQKFGEYQMVLALTVHM